MTAEEKEAFRKYGRLPANKTLLKPPVSERKFFDSGDYAMQKAGKVSAPVGQAHPSPSDIPHTNPQAPQTHLPTKESALVHPVAPSPSPAPGSTTAATSADGTTSSTTATTAATSAATATTTATSNIHLTTTSA
ncbi:hypothetical protein GQ42DRAFT_162927 [Ramicandelaber brevisporus]|nr:hypothetical protein GQ42DRAFT_162927 [Ramicandelaber brevisporus]